MKRIIALLLAILCLLSLSACKKKEGIHTQETKPTASITTQPTTIQTLPASESTDPTDDPTIPVGLVPDYTMPTIVKPATKPNFEHPTKKPTEVPTQKPTQPATQKPTQKPNQAPTEKPIQPVTKEPTQKPTQIATKNPTQPVTQKPTQEPTPTSNRKPIQTTMPQRPQIATKSPTHKPTETPTVIPTQALTEATTNPMEERFVSEARARYCAGERNGYSVFEYSSYKSSYSTTKEYNACVDYNGYIVFKFSEKEDAISNVKHNFFVTKERVIENNTSFDVYRIREASTGKVLYSASTKDGYYFVDLKYSAKLIWDDGYTVVVQMEEAFDGVTYKLGVLGSDGEWIVPLDMNNPVVKTLGKQASLDKFTEMYYMGEGVLHFAVDNTYYFYNIEKNTVTKVESELSDYDTKSVLKCADEFQDGITTDKYGWGGGFCKISSDGKITIIPVEFHEDLHENIGSYYYDRINNRVIQMGDTYHQDGFSIFDSNGNVIKKLENVNILKSYGFSQAGYARLILENTEGTQYYTVMDTDGNFLFDPIKTEGLSVVDAKTGNVLDPDLNDKRYILVDRNGEILYKRDTHGGFGYNNGVVYDENATEKYIIID